MSTDYISPADLVIFMKGAVLENGLAQLAVRAAQKAVRKYLDQEITLVENDVVALDGNDKDTLRLSERPVIRVDSVVEDGTTLTSDLYLVRNSLIIRKDKTHFGVGRGNVVVTFDHGWCVESTADADFSDSAGDIQDPGCETVPGDIVLATLSAARRAYNSSGADDTDGLAGETIGAYSWTGKSLQVELIAGEKALLGPYRVPSGRNTGTR